MTHPAKTLLDHPAFRLSAVAVAIITLLSCASAPQTPQRPIVVETPTTTLTPSRVVIVKPQTPTAPVTTSTPTPAPSVENRYYGSFGDWKSDFITRTIASGHASHAVHGLLGSASLNSQVISLDGRQAEFAKMPWSYVESAVTSGRVSDGRAKLREYPSLLSRAESQYGVPKEVMVAIWGIESSYGAATGSTDLVDALSSLAFDGRRREFAESELLAMLQMIEHSDVSRSQLRGSWAGGMGHTQFIPSTWIKYGVDGNGDGQKNPWTISDALTSTAHYLGASGWVSGVDAFYEVRLPTGFNYQLLGQKQSLESWKSLGVVSANGEYFGGHAQAELWLPAGVNGPALLLTPNFDVIKVYNNSSSYALAVATLAKRIAGGAGISGNWPRHEQPLSRSEVIRLQETLNAKGYSAGKADGVAGANTSRAFARWQADNGRIPDGFITQNSVRGLVW
ncbi:MAG: lytic murein transglycosylase [Moraxella equi]|nr:lytic murein transglycosylase [Moraxella equi]